MSGEPQPILRIAGLAKHYGGHVAVRDASFDVFEGDVFGFLGPNGAGKTTTFSILAGLVRPTAGRIEIFGLPHTDLVAVRSRVGMLIETPAFYDHLSGRKNLEILARLHPPRASDGRRVDRRRVDEVLDMVGLLPRAGDRVGRYSHGMRQRLGIAQSLLGWPRLLVLDEPTNGLDPDGSARVWALLRRLARDERLTVVVSSHLLHEVEESCNRIAVIDHGVVVACDQVRSLLFFSKEDSLLVFDDAERRGAAEDFLRARAGVELLMIGAEGTGAWSLAAAVTGATSPSQIAPDSPDAAVLDPRFQTGRILSGAAALAPGEEHAIRIRTAQGETSGVLAELVSNGLAPRAVIPQRKTLRQFFLELTRRQPDRPPLR